MLGNNKQLAQMEGDMGTNPSISAIPALVVIALFATPPASQVRSNNADTVATEDSVGIEPARPAPITLAQNCRNGRCY